MTIFSINSELVGFFIQITHSSFKHFFLVPHDYKALKTSGKSQTPSQNKKRVEKARCLFLVSATCSSACSIMTDSIDFFPFLPSFQSWRVDSTEEARIKLLFCPFHLHHCCRKRRSRRRRRVKRSQKLSLCFHRRPYPTPHPYQRKQVFPLKRDPMITPATFVLSSHQFLLTPNLRQRETNQEIQVIIKSLKYDE